MADVHRKFFAVLVVVLSAAGVTNADDVSTQAILEGLKPAHSLKRSAFADGLSMRDIEFLSHLPTRGLKVEQRERLTEIVATKELPRIDIRIQFELGSAEINMAADRQIQALGVALADASMQSVRIALNGHTDATGTNEHNLRLSEARAISVRRALLEGFDIDPKMLIAVGFGEEQLKDLQDPEGPINRRVEVVRLTP